MKYAIVRLRTSLRGKQKKGKPLSKFTKHLSDQTHCRVQTGNTVRSSGANQKTERESVEMKYWTTVQRLCIHTHSTAHCSH